MTAVPVLIAALGALGVSMHRGHRARAVRRIAGLYLDRPQPSIGWLPSFVVAALTAADLSASQARQSVAVVRAGLMGSVLLGLVFGVGAGLTATLVIVGLAVVALVAARNRREHKVLAALPDAVELVARSLRSGASVVQALDDVSSSVTGPLGVAFARVVADTRRGASLSRALQRLVTRSPHSEVRVVVVALTLASESGAGPARALDGVSTSLRDSQRLRAELAALTSQARASAMVLIALPVAFVVVNAALDPSALRFLLHDTAGRLCLSIGLALDVLGWIWMRGLVKQVQA